VPAQTYRRSLLKGEKGACLRSAWYLDSKAHSAKVFEGLWKLAHDVQRVSVVVQGGKEQEEDEGLRREVFKRSFAYQNFSSYCPFFGS
jgi:hypothetical protein